MSGENEIPAEVIQEARNMGWVPKEQYKGAEGNFVDADEFVEKGRHVMPILLQNNKRLQQELLTRDQKIGTLEQQFQKADQAIEKLTKQQVEVQKRSFEEGKKALALSLKQARENDDVDSEQRILEELIDLRAEEKAAATAPKKEPEKKEEYTQALSPDYKSWLAENPWYGPDKKKTKEYTRLAEDLREEGNVSTGADFYADLDAAYVERFGEVEPKRQSKVESGNNRSGSRGAKTFANLPAAAKQACHEDADVLVGPNCRYKTLQEWEVGYAKIYYDNEEA
tara:strand:+ start:445 stop:1290 length:846 start_codon:yes stop_codon:yes gene_type:complete